MGFHKRQGLCFGEYYIDAYGVDDEYDDDDEDDNVNDDDDDDDNEGG